MENSPQTNAFSISLKVLTGLCMVIYMSTLFTNKDKDVTVASTTPEANQTNVLEIPGNITKRTKSVIIQPSSLKPDELIILDDILKEYVLEKTMCRPEDVTNLKKHKVPKAMSKTNKITEPKGMMVVYIAVGLLLTSLGAAFVEVFKAKQQPTTKSKPALARRCSLADLTVLRHNRKEMMRRDSIMDMVDHRGAPKLLGRKVSRPPLRLE